MATKKNEDVNLINIDAKTNRMEITISGTGDLVLNKMNARNERMLIADDRKSIREVPNVWEDIITAMHWQKPLSEYMKDTYKESNEEILNKLFSDNAPCISAFGLKKSFGQAVTRNEIDKYSTKFDPSVNIIATNNLIPIKFESWECRTQLMSPKRGAPITTRLNHFHNWEATFEIDYLDHVYSRDQILNIINLAGFGLGIGSGRTSGYGRYHITNVAA